jgi:hypothetical protein
LLAGALQSALPAVLGSAFGPMGTAVGAFLGGPAMAGVSQAIGSMSGGVAGQTDQMSRLVLLVAAGNEVQSDLRDFIKRRGATTTLL